MSEVFFFTLLPRRLRSLVSIGAALYDFRHATAELLPNLCQRDLISLILERVDQDREAAAAWIGAENRDRRAPGIEQPAATTPYKMLQPSRREAGVVLLLWI